VPVSALESAGANIIAPQLHAVGRVEAQTIFSRALQPERFLHHPCTNSQFFRRAQKINAEKAAQFACERASMHDESQNNFADLLVHGCCFYVPSEIEFAN